MRVAFITGEVPCRELSTVAYSGYLLVKALKKAEHNVDILVLVDPTKRPEWKERRLKWISDLSDLGATTQLLEWSPPSSSIPLGSSPQRGIRKWLARMRALIWPKISDFFPHATINYAVQSEIEKINPNVIFLWVHYEVAAATSTLNRWPKLFMTGDPGHLPDLYREKLIEHPTNNFVLTPKQIQRRLIAWRKSQAMITILKNVDSFFVSGHNNALWFQKNGIPLCEAVYGVSPDWGGLDWRKKRRALEGRSGRFRIAHVGHLLGTATLVGIRLLAEEIVPILENRLGDTFDVHIYSRGDIPSDLNEKLNRPNIYRRGHVPDIVSEILECDVFLVPTPIDLGVRIRIAYAWSCGACVITHQASRGGIPHLVHNENCMIGRNGAEIAEHLIHASSNQELRHQLGVSGRKTFKKHFSMESAGQRVIEQLERLAAIGQ